MKPKKRKREREPEPPENREHSDNFDPLNYGNVEDMLIDGA